MVLLCRIVLHYLDFSLNESKSELKEKTEVNLFRSQTQHICIKIIVDDRLVKVHVN